MTVQWSTAMRNAIANQWAAVFGANAKLLVYSGAMPANVAAATTGTLLLEYDLASVWASAASGGAISIASLPIPTTGSNNGTAGYYRIFQSDGTTCHEQGTVTATGGGGDATIDNTTVAAGQTVQLTAYTKTTPGA
jgi:hypothetical protein